MIRHTLTRHWRLLFLLLATALAFWILFSLRGTIFAFVLGVVIAYLLMPVVRWLERRLPGQGRWRGAKRTWLIILVFLVILGLLGFLSYYIITAIIDAFTVLFQNASDYINGAIQTLQQWTEAFRRQFPPEIRDQIDQYIQQAGAFIGSAIQNFFRTGISLIPTVFGLIVGLAALPIFTFYIMRDWEQIGQGFFSNLPGWAREHTSSILSIIEGVLGRYIRAQIILGVAVGLMALTGLLGLRIDLAPGLAVVAGVTEIIPVLGPWIGGATAVIVTLATAPDKVIWVGLLFWGIQMLENQLLVPRIHAVYLHLHPAVVIVLLVLGAHFAGFWGLVLAVPLTATIVQIYRYALRATEAEDREPPVL